MNHYQKGKLIIFSDYEIRTLREEQADMDIYIDTEGRTMNLHLPVHDPKRISRLQLPKVRGILIRFCTREDAKVATIHFLGNIDLQSHFMNFEMDYEEYTLKVIDREYSIDFICETK